MSICLDPVQDQKVTYKGWEKKLKELIQQGK